MRYIVDLPAEDWPTLPEPGELVAELTGRHALPVTVISAGRVGDLVRLELDAPARQIINTTLPDRPHVPGYRASGSLTAPGTRT